MNGAVFISVQATLTKMATAMTAREKKQRKNRRMKMKSEDTQAPCKHRKREMVDGVELDMCYAIGIERIGDMPCEYCVERDFETKERKC